MNKTISIVRPSSREAGDLLSERIDELRHAGWQVFYEEMGVDPSWPFVSASREDRLEQLTDSLTNPNSDIVWCARGGYGSSDLLDGIDWSRLSQINQPKLVIGFSDVSALHCALYARLGWKGLHAPMPATVLWRKDGNDEDLKVVMQGLELGSWQVKIDLSNERHIFFEKNQIFRGPLFGGCFSVLTNLIGTPYFPKTLENHILFLEDTQENPGRLARYLNQWIQSGALRGVKAIVLGHFRDCADPAKEELYIHRMFAKRTNLPIFVCEKFGHTSPNFPLMIGAEAQLSTEELVWSDAGNRGKEGMS